MDLFLDTIMDQCIYKAVILDLGDCVSGLYDILKNVVVYIRLIYKMKFLWQNEAI